LFGNAPPHSKKDLLDPTKVTLNDYRYRDHSFEDSSGGQDGMQLRNSLPTLNQASLKFSLQNLNKHVNFNGSTVGLGDSGEQPYQRHKAVKNLFPIDTSAY
jgi:hypothetical protein